MLVSGDFAWWVKLARSLLLLYLFICFFKKSQLFTLPLFLSSINPPVASSLNKTLTFKTSLISLFFLKYLVEATKLNLSHLSLSLSNINGKPCIRENCDWMGSKGCQWSFVSLHLHLEVQFFNNFKYIFLVLYMYIILKLFITEFCFFLCHFHGFTCLCSVN